MQIGESVKGERNPMYGKHHSKRSKKKISKSMIGENNSNSKPVVQIDPNTNEIINTYFGTREAARQTGFDYSNISKCCRGKLKTTGGFKWVYLSDYIDLIKEERYI